MNKKQLWSLLATMAILLSGCASPTTQSSSAEIASKQGLSTKIAGSPEAPPTPNSATDSSGAPLKGGATLKLTEEQNGGLAALVVNDTMEVVIDGNPTTGFIWEAENLDTTLLQQQGDPTYAAASNLTGSGGYFTFTFKALKAGVTHLRLIYHRTFEKGVPPARIYEITVDIQQ